MSESRPGPRTDEARYRPVLSMPRWSRTLNAIWQDAYGDDYPAEVEPLGFSTLSELSLMRRWLGVGTGDSIVDIGCGRGGPGLWLAQRTGASLVGVDLVAEAVEQATLRAQALGSAVSARFQVGDFRDTRLPTAAFEGAVSVDSVWMVPDKVAAIREVARLLLPGGRWVFSTWEPPYLSYVRLLEVDGWEVLTCREPAKWYERQLAVYRDIIGARDRLVAELGPVAAQVLVSEAREMAPTLHEYRRLVIATRR